MENYEKRLKDIVSSRNTPFADIGVILRYFPELRESEDEKWRKWLIGHLSGYINQTDAKYAEACKNAIAWLEKRGEQKSDDKVESTKHSYITTDSEFFQWIYDRLKYVHGENPNVDYMLSLKERIEDMHKSTNWSESDNDMMNAIICLTKLGRHLEEEHIDWIKSIKDRVQPQLQQEWTEENEAILDDIIAAFKRIGNNCEHYFSPDTAKVFGKTLESLKNRVTLQHKSGWSEDDEQYLLVCKNALAKYQTTDKWDAGIISHWLENKLKDRVQPKQ